MVNKYFDWEFNSFTAENRDQSPGWSIWRQHSDDNSAITETVSFTAEEPRKWTVDRHGVDREFAICYSANSTPVISNLAPPDALSVTVISHSWASTISLTMVRPNPVPPSSEE